MRSQGHLKPTRSHYQASTCMGTGCFRTCNLNTIQTPKAALRSLCTQHAAWACRNRVHSTKLRLVGAAAAPSSASAHQQEQHECADELSALEHLLVWLVNNGVTGIGLDDSKVQLYEAADGDRGIIAVQDIPSGEQLIAVPLRLAITDVINDEQKRNIVGEGALWQDRLVAKLLQQVQAGQNSPWYPYIQALPKHIPSALDTFTDAEAEYVQLPAVVAAIKAYCAKISASWQSCCPDSICGADLLTYRWAHTVVMSRTFGNASQSGGIGVRMLVPLIDMLNHAADETESGLLFDTAIPKDNVRWDVVSPANNPAGCWQMVLSTTQHIPADSPLQLSYIEGANNEFLLHYGFVPGSNPHDTVQLFSSVTAALEHLWQQDMAQGKAAEQLSPVYSQALDAGLAALQQEVAAAAAGAADADWGPLLDALEPVKVASGSRVSGPLIAALEVLHQGDMAAVEVAVSGVAWQQLQALPTHLVSDLVLLVVDAQQQGDAEAVRLYGRLLRYYSEAMVPEYLPALHDRIRQCLANTTPSSSSSSSTDDSTAIAPLTKKKRKAVPAPPPASSTAAATARASLPKTAAAESQLQDGITAESIRTLPLAKLVQAFSPDSSSISISSSSSTSSTALTHAKRTAVKFRLSKKMLLADVVIAAKVPYAVLQQWCLPQQDAAAAPGSCMPECHALPWQQQGSQ